MIVNEKPFVSGPINVFVSSKSSSIYLLPAISVGLSPYQNWIDFAFLNFSIWIAYTKKSYQAPKQQARQGLFS